MLAGIGFYVTAINNKIKFIKKIFGTIKKIISSLCNKRKKLKQQMLRTQKHIEAKNWFSPIGYDTNCGATKLRNK